MGRIICPTHGGQYITFACEHVASALHERRVLDTVVVTMPLFADPELVARDPELMSSPVRYCVPCHARGVQPTNELSPVCPLCESDWFSR